MDTEVFKSNGGTTRAAVTVLSAIYLALLVTPHLFRCATVIPYPMLGGQYFYLGFENLYQHLGPVVFHQLDRREYAMVCGMLILYIATSQQLILALGVGTAWALLIFIQTLSGHGNIFYKGLSYGCPSFSARTYQQHTSLTMQASRTYVVRLDGLLTFAQVQHVADEIEKTALAARAKPIKCYLIDFEMVQKIDTSAGIVLDRLFDSLHSLGTQLIVISGTQGKGIRRSFERHSATKIQDGIIIFQPTYDKACSHVVRCKPNARTRGLHARTHTPFAVPACLSLFVAVLLFLRSNSAMAS